MPIYTKEFKWKLICEVTEKHRPMMAVSKEYGISRGSIYNWMKEFDADGHIVINVTNTIHRVSK